MNDEAKPTYLYHYTTAAGLKGIVEKREIWATDIFYLNDRREFFYGRDAFLKLERRLRDKTEGEDQAVHHKNIKGLKYRGLGDRPHTFVCSFSTAEEGDDLSQWRAYCPDGGYAIGFPLAKLRSVGTETGFDLWQCRYGGSPRMGKDLVGRLHELSPAVHANTIVAMCYIAAIVKHPSFAGEKEWRLISGLKSTVQPVFRARGNLLIPYVQVSLKESDLWKDVRIVVGPCSRETEDLRLESVKMLFESEVEKGNFPTPCPENVRSSKIPYRTAMAG